MPFSPSTLPALGGGGDVVGSGKLGTPCERMHLASASSCEIRLPDDLPWPLGLCVSLPHACWAVLNAGDWVLMSFGITSPPAGLGSGNGPDTAEVQPGSCARDEERQPVADVDGLLHL